MFKVGNVIGFVYNGKNRRVRIDRVEMGYRYFGLVGPSPRVITGWDYNADYPTGGYRSFLVEKIDTAILKNDGQGYKVD